MRPVARRRILRRRLRSLNRRERFVRGIERKRRRRIQLLSLRQKARLEKRGRVEQRRMKEAERRRKISAKRETAKLNRTLRRRRKR